MSLFIIRHEGDKKTSGFTGSVEELGGIKSSLELSRTFDTSIVNLRLV